METANEIENNETKSKLFFPEREETPVYELPENFEEILGISDDLIKREKANIESLLFSENKKIGGESSRDLFDKKEKEMLEEEREKYVDYLCDKFKGLIPDILCDKSLFDKEWKVKKKSHRGVAKAAEKGEGEEDEEEEDEGENFMTDEEDEVDDYNVNDYDAEDNGGDMED